MAAEFELYKSGSQYRWRLQAGNNEVVASGEAYTSKTAALKGIDAVKKAAATAEGQRQDRRVAPQRNRCRRW